MRIVVDRELCTGQAMCEAVADDFFQVTAAGQVEIRVGAVPEDRLVDVELAVSCCPNEALELVP
jgi:ferredoxin